MKWMLILLCCSCSCIAAFSQQYMTRNGVARFYSRTDLEDIEAENKQVLAVIDPAGKRIAVSLLMKGFLFKKELMQDHFNENYAESDRYPKAVFEGGFMEALDPNYTGTLKLQVRGKLTLHGVTHEVDVPATLEIKDGQISGKSTFQVVPEDYGIRIPNLVRDKISRKVEVFIAFTCRKQ